MARSDDTPIQDLRNLGPRCQQNLNAIGIFTLGDIKAVGVEPAFEMLIGYHLANRSGRYINATFLCALYGAVHDLDWREIPAEKKVRFKALSSALRAQHRGKNTTRD